MAKLPAFRFHNDEVVVPSAKERIAEALADVRAGLEHVDDRRVWNGYPDGWPENKDEDEPSAPVGLFLSLERCTRGAPTWQMAMAIEVAFNLGKRAEGGRIDPKLQAKLDAHVDARRRGQEGATAARNRWQDKAKPIWQENRGQYPEGHPRRLTQGTVAEDIEKIAGAPSHDRIVKWISKWDREVRSEVDAG
jgi:hypothetical protein